MGCAGRWEGRGRSTGDGEALVKMGRDGMGWDGIVLRWGRAVSRSVIRFPRGVSGARWACL